ncbi:Epoxide hydrolase A [Linum perenne]
MDQIKHKFVEVNGSNLHLAEIGAGDKVVVCLHGFPEIWYSWRHQMIALASAGFRVIAPDHRGYGLSDPSLEPEKTKFADLIADVLHPGRVLGLVTLGIPFSVPIKGASLANQPLPEGFYVSRWREPGRAEADFGRLDAKTVVRNVYILFSGSELPTAAENQEIMDLVDQSTPLPPWLSEEDLDVYGALYQKSGFRTALKMPYR